MVQASRDLDVGKSLFRRWLKEFSSDPGQAFPGQGQLKPKQQEIERLRREVAKLKAERDILKKPRWIHLCPAPSLAVSVDSHHPSPATQHDRSTVEVNRRDFTVSS